MRIFIIALISVPDKKDGSATLFRGRAGAPLRYREKSRSSRYKEKFQNNGGKEVQQ